MNVRASSSAKIGRLLVRYSNALVGALIVAAGVGLFIALWLGWIDILAHTTDASLEQQQPVAQPPMSVELPPEKLAAAGIETTTVVNAAVQPTRAVPGEIKYDAARRVPLSSPVAGVIAEVLVQPSQQIGKGEPLAVLSSPEIGLARDEVLKHEAELALARREQRRADEVAQNVVELLSLLAQRPKLEDVESNLQGRMLGDYREKIVSAYSKLLLAERVSGASAALEGGSLSNRLIDERRSAREQAAALFQAACETSRFDAIQRRDKARADAEQAERLLAVAQQKLSNLLGPWADMTPVTEREHLSELKLLAPIAGRIEERQAIASGRVVVGDPLFTVADTSTMWVSAEIHERDWRALDFLHADDNLPVRVPAIDAVLKAKVLFIGSQLAADTRSVPLVAELPDADRRLRPGMFVWAVIPIDQPREALVVPAGAIMRHDNQAFVFVPAGGRTFRRVDVQIGDQANEQVEILSGLSAGDEVVHRGAFFLKSELLLEREEE